MTTGRINQVTTFPNRTPMRSAHAPGSSVNKTEFRSQSAVYTTRCSASHVIAPESPTHSHLARLPRSVPFLANAMQQSCTKHSHASHTLHKGSLRCELRIAPSQPKRASSARAFSLLCCVISLHIVKQYKLPHSRTRCAMHQCFRSPLWLIRIRAIRGSIRSLEHLFHPNAERQFVTIQ